MNTKSGPYPFTAKQEQYRGYTLEALRFNHKDALEARDVSKGWNPEAEAWYQDDAATISAEIFRRERARPSETKPELSGAEREILRDMFGLARQALAAVEDQALASTILWEHHEQTKARMRALVEKLIGRTS